MPFAMKFLSGVCSDTGGKIKAVLPEPLRPWNPKMPVVTWNPGGFNSDSKTFNPKALEPSNPGTFKRSNPETHGAFYITPKLLVQPPQKKKNKPRKSSKTGTLEPLYPENLGLEISVCGPCQKIKHAQTKPITLKLAAWKNQTLQPSMLSNRGALEPSNPGAFKVSNPEFHGAF